jgi:hypothetical protein
MRESVHVAELCYVAGLVLRSLQKAYVEQWEPILLGNAQRTVWLLASLHWSGGSELCPWGGSAAVELGGRPRILRNRMYDSIQSAIINIMKA